MVSGHYAQSTNLSSALNWAAICSPMPDSVSRLPQHDGDSAEDCFPLAAALACRARGCSGCGPCERTLPANRPRSNKFRVSVYIAHRRPLPGTCCRVVPWQLQIHDPTYVWLLGWRPIVACRDNGIPAEMFTLGLRASSKTPGALANPRLGWQRCLVPLCEW